MRAEAASLTGDRVDLEIFDGVKTTKLLAQTTLSAFVIVNICYLPAPELVVLPDGGTEQQVQVGSINIAIGQHLSLCQSSKRAHNAGLPGASFTA
jgi:hypothetical protein